MPQVSILRSRIVDGSLPSVCIICGADAPRRFYPHISSPSLAWMLFSPTLNLLTFWIYILVGTRSQEKPAGLPFCDRHGGYWPRRAWFIVGGFAILMGLIVSAIVLTTLHAANEQNGSYRLAGLVVGCWMLIFLPAFLIVQRTATRPTTGNAYSLVLAGVSREFVASLTDH